MSTASRSVRAAAVLRMGLVCLVAVAPLVSAGICSGCESRCTTLGGCCHADEPAAIDTAATSCCSVVVETTCCSQAAAGCDAGQHDAAERPGSGCHCMLEPRDDRSAAATTPVVDELAPSIAIVSPQAWLSEASVDGRGSLRDHLFHAPTRPVRVLYGVWRN